MIPTLMCVLVAVITAATTADITLTLVAMRGGASESNPILRAIGRVGMVLLTIALNAGLLAQLTHPADSNTVAGLVLGGGIILATRVWAVKNNWAVVMRVVQR